MTSVIARWTGFFGILFIPLFLTGSELPEPGKGKEAFVYDEAGMFSMYERNLLIEKLAGFRASTSNEFAVVVEQSIGDGSAFDRSVAIAEHWGLGSEELDNGLLIYIAVKEMEIFIPVGDGLEGAITDGQTERIIRKIIVPRFREGKYYDGVDRALDKLMELASGEYKNPVQKVPDQVWVVIGIIALILIMMLVSGRGGRTYTGRRHSTWPWGWGGGGWSSGSGGFGGFGGGGGFGGFGGGSFGGGGAGGSWR